MSLDRMSTTPFLKTRLLGKRQYLWREEMGSTNREAARLARQGGSSGDVVVCDYQTGGRGRMSRSWEASPGEDITLSVLWKPKELTQAPLYPLATAVAVCRVLQSLVGGTAVKWPNDVLIQGKKVCGILCELHGDIAVIGVGLNVNRKHFPEELTEKATSLSLSSGRDFPLPPLLAELLLCLEEELTSLEEKGFAMIREAYLPLCATLHRTVRVLSPVEEWYGCAENVDENGCLTVRDESGRLRTVQAGDVSVRGLMGYTDPGGDGY